MKSIVILSLSILTLAFIGCDSEVEVNDSDSTPVTYLEGQFAGLDSGYMYLVPARNALSFRNFVDAVDSFPVDSTGAFSGSVAALTADHYALRFNDKPGDLVSFYLKEGDSVSLKFDDNYQVVGESTQAGEVRYRNLVNQRFMRDRYPGFSFFSYGLPVDSMVMLFDEIEVAQTALLDSMRSEQLISEEYAALAESEIAAYRVQNLLNHVYYYYYVNTGEFHIPAIDSMHPGLSDEVLALDDQYYFGMMYGQALSRFLEIKGFEATAALPDSVVGKQKLALSVQLVKEHFTGVGQEFMLFQLSERFAFSLDEMRNDFFSEADEIDSYFKEMRGESTCYEQFSYNLNRLKQLRPGLPAPAIELPDRDGNLVSLESFRGSVVYVDFWGSWCMPCLKQIPDAKALHERTEEEGLDIVFLTIALEGGDDQIAAWKEILDREALPGVHLLAEGQFGHPVPKSYAVASAPTYLIIDQAGNVAYPRASRPGSVYDELLEVAKGQ